MTQDEIIEMAGQANFLTYPERTYILSPHPSEDADLYEELEAFAKLVAAKEREACAKEADKRLHDFTMLTSNPPQSGAAFSIVQAIRARGEA